MSTRRADGGVAAGWGAARPGVARRARQRVALVAAAAASFVMPPARPAGAQAGTDRVTAGLRARNLAANAAIGAAVSGVRAAVRRRPVAPALARGLAGGVALGAGKQLAARRFGGAGAVGRLVTAAGVAAVYTAPGDSLAAFLPVGPVTVELRPGARDRVRPRVNGWTTAVLLVALFDANSRLDAGASLDAGAVVFRRRSGAMPWGGGELGFAFPGVVFVSDRAEDAARRRLVVAHEAVHVQQWDAYHATVTRDAERALVGRVPGGARVLRWLEPDVLAPLSVWAVAEWVPYARQPWEREAFWLSGQRPP